ncbi:amidohydrolase family protein [Shewanella woodyi]|uniref:amidohydrolase family protein n=1 Tax=Shewanella woodyi TaxID=60961 RepID=UPI0007F9278A|nr:amidohydrolase family protein [Shewanella woodyi]
MRLSLLKKWLFGAVLFLLLASLITYTWVEYQMTQRAGGHTQIIEREQFSPTSGPILIENVNLLSADGLTMLPDQSILLENGKIAHINPPQERVDSLLNNPLIVDGSNKYLIPGLVDSHVHLERSPNDLLLYLANGITYIRDMGGVPEYVAWRKQIREDLIGPDIFIASEKVNSLSGIEALFNSWTRTRINVSTHEQVNKLVKSLVDDGFDAIKISSFINEEIYHQLLDSGKAAGLPTVGHLPYSIGLNGLWHSGQTELAHVEEITKALSEDFGGYHHDRAEQYLSYVEMRSNRVGRKLKEKQIAVTSSIWLMESLTRQKFALTPLLKEIALPYANPGIVEGTVLAKGSLPGHNSYQLSQKTLGDPQAVERSKRFWLTYVSAIHIMTQALNNNDVLFMAGTDANTAAVVPGFSLHDELNSLTQAGLSNAQSLYSATAAPGEWMRSNTGKIKSGYRADLVLLDSNPLLDINNTRSINAVFREGRMFDRAQLDAMLAEVLRVNDKARHQGINQFN